MTFFEAAIINIDTGLSLFGIFANFLLLFCIIFKSPRSVGSYTLLLMNTTIGDLITCLLTLYIEPRIILYQNDMYIIFNGLCKFLGKKSCAVGYSLMMIFYAHLSMSQLGSFIYRRYVLTHLQPLKRQVALFLLALASPSIVIFFGASLPYCLSVMNLDATEQIVKIHPDLAGKNITHLAALDAFTNLMGSIPTTWICAPILPITIIVVLIRRAILANLSEKIIMSANTKKMHQSFLKALTLQSILPPIFLIGITCLMVDIVFQFHYVPLEYASYFLPGFIPLFSPIFSLYFVKSYSSFLRGCFGKAKVRPTTILITINSSNSTTRV